MEYWIFQPLANITVLELANLAGKLRRIPKAKLTFLGVSDDLYDEMPKDYKRHFKLYSPNHHYQDYTEE